MRSCEVAACPRLGAYSVAQRYSADGRRLPAPEPRWLCQEHSRELRARETVQAAREVATDEPPTEQRPEEALPPTPSEILDGIRLAELQARSLRDELGPHQIVALVQGALEIIFTGQAADRLAPLTQIITTAATRGRHTQREE